MSKYTIATLATANVNRSKYIQCTYIYIHIYIFVCVCSSIVCTQTYLNTLNKYGCICKEKYLPVDWYSSATNAISWRDCKIECSIWKSLSYNGRTWHDTIFIMPRNKDNTGYCASNLYPQIMKSTPPQKVLILFC